MVPIKNYNPKKDNIKKLEIYLKKQEKTKPKNNNQKDERPVNSIIL
jgi:hypothetical protein